ncbi:ParB/RepB/Spo0J family partition protein [Endozoicomonas sp. SM1973]|uniref:Probable chromosome-partitioning protein ParB n=1 Tax=Spartinivicinus marinus TaxID=2994442 RepID=A0A853HZU1_9GAMM|nr:ParB/RepB/Spo0J family partition protein [Spartinivicinus marinus]MCX4026788.1 ParB/RepB/Spo0J family partition protein [Spartinivicinus marinus]NYZ64622.1 ParB/RepB/Spo0J family partition protein [Spartinivicinus marinus]
MATKKRGLGRGLDALLGSATATTVVETGNEQNSQLDELPVEWIQRGRYQPRRDMHPEALEELASSIKAQGVMQPIVVRPIGQNKYEIIAGERRWRATQLAGLEKIPAVIREVPDEAAIAMALIENIQREDLNPIEEAMALHRLQQEFGLTQQQVADAVGKSRATITNLLRLMTLADDVKTMLEHGDLEMGHARAILTLTKTQQLVAAKTIVAKGLSVRQTEALVRHMQAEAETTKPEQKIDPDIKQLEDELGDKLGTEVLIQHSAKGKGKLVIKYNNLDELDGVLAHIK